MKTLKQILVLCFVAAAVSTPGAYGGSQSFSTSVGSGYNGTNWNFTAVAAATISTSVWVQFFDPQYSTGFGLSSISPTGSGEVVGAFVWGEGYTNETDSNSVTNQPAGNYTISHSWGISAVGDWVSISTNFQW